MDGRNRYLREGWDGQGGEGKIGVREMEVREVEIGTKVRVEVGRVCLAWGDVFIEVVGVRTSLQNRYPGNEYLSDDGENKCVPALEKTPFIKMTVRMTKVFIVSLEREREKQIS